MKFQSQKSKSALTLSFKRKLVATPTLLYRQNPIGSPSSAWCPGGLTIANAESSSPLATFSATYVQQISSISKLKKTYTGTNTEKKELKNFHHPQGGKGLIILCICCWQYELSCFLVKTRLIWCTENQLEIRWKHLFIIN